MSDTRETVRCLSCGINQFMAANKCCWCCGASLVPPPPGADFAGPSMIVPAPPQPAPRLNVPLASIPAADALLTDKTDAWEQRQDEQRQKSADAPCKTEGELDDPETWRGIGEASEQEPPAIEGCNHLRECGFCLAERDMFAKDYVAQQTAAPRNDTEANRPASVSEGIWEFYEQHYESFNDGSIDADEMCEFASAYAAQQTVEIRRVLNDTEAERARLQAQLTEARGEVDHLREQLEQAKVDAVPQLT